MKLFVRNADNTKVKELTVEQFMVVHDFVIARMNAGKKIKDEEVVQRLQEAGCPIDFTQGTVEPKGLK